MKLGIAGAALLSVGLLAAPAARAQAAPAQQAKPAENHKPPADRQKPGGANPFPEDTGNVPVMPNGNTPPPAEQPPDNAAASTLPKGDVDPVRSPDDPPPDAAGDAQGFSSSSAGMDKVMPPPDTDVDKARARKGRNQPAGEHQESAVEDEKVGQLYLDEKNWKAALSRYESAVILDPENPEVYWGLGEAQRHLGKLAEAKASYEKLVEYDPDSKHGKEAKKILKAPEMANAPTASAAKP